MCSIAVETMCRCPLVSPDGANPRIAKLLLSVAPLVNMTSSGFAPTTAATWSRARSTALRARRPYSCVLLPAFPTSLNQPSTTSRTAGSMGVVALQSR